ncbi:putative duf1183 domain protein [Lasiodiplodia theobromae]|nr:putative duf1183 domain protein [Lasiodiplodia theobromae]
MRLSSFLAPALLALAASETAEAARDSVLLSKIKSLTLRNGQKTTARRVSPIPQLKCIGGDAKGLYEVDVMRCKNAGSDYDDDNIQWTCQASLPEEFKLGSTDVICEGYDSPDDPYILKGSCGVEYRLMLTPKGLDRYGHRKGGRSGSGEDDQISQGIAILFWVVFFGVIIWMVFKACIVGGGDAGDPNTWTATTRATKDGGLDSGPVHWEALLLVTWRVIVAIEEAIRHSHVEAIRGETTQEKDRLDRTNDRRRQVIRGTKVPALARLGGDNSVCNATKS